MTDGDLKRKAMDSTKEIVVAKLSVASPAHTNADEGKKIGEMYEAIYNKIYEIAKNIK